MKPHSAFLLFSLLAAAAARADLQTDWAYHAIGSGDRATERVPGESSPFWATAPTKCPTT
jgi:hypothetical protein